MSEKAAAESHWKLMMDRDYLAAADLRGRDVALTIKSVSAGDLPIAGTKKTQRRPVVTFEETPKKVVLNPTNCQTVSDLYGPLTRDWAGKRITLYPTDRERDGKPIRNPKNGKPCEGLRIRDVEPPAKQRKGETEPALSDSQRDEPATPESAP